MPARPLVLFPDRRLSLPANPVDEFGSRLKALADDVADTLLAASAIGLTAPHIGISERVMVIRLSPDEDLRIYVNPQIFWASPETAVHDEGSISMPGVRERITRPARIRFGFHDLAGATHEEEAEGFFAAVVQHEIDQLNGIFWIDRLSRLKRDRLLKRFEKLKSASSL
ncbi:peptide deformylase [Methylobacterium sp. J-072]|uniref:peptide deformylase n=1 Tax=Methylobacterium sp. J-072 TaxID=2836651 RepID=UPI001FB9380F|nr:peptide deformylase [Methylobacterium sp. J-072]MCJ2091885.1 peptide deformylase [Methylobacterium sp. J-072]